MDKELLAELSESLKKTEFFGTNAFYLSHKSNLEYNTREAVNDGILDFPVLFVEANWDGVCATSSTQACEPQRAHCKNLTEVTLDAGHWPQLEKPDEVNATIARWLSEELKGSWPGFWSHPFAKISKS